MNNKPPIFPQDFKTPKGCTKRYNLESRGWELEVQYQYTYKEYTILVSHLPESSEYEIVAFRDGEHYYTTKYNRHIESIEMLQEDLNYLCNSLYFRPKLSNKPLKLYKITRPLIEDEIEYNRYEYDTYDSAVVLARTPKEAQNTHPQGFIKEGKQFNHEWDESKNIIVEYLGIYAGRRQKGGVITASYNAG